MHDSRRMYLVHVHLWPPPGGVLSADVATLLMQNAHSSERVEHAVSHGQAEGSAVVGLYLLAATAAEAEHTAARLCARALATVPELRGCTVESCAVPPLSTEPGAGRLMPRTDYDGRSPFPFT